MRIAGWALVLVLLGGCSSSDNDGSGKPAINEAALLSAPNAYQTKVVDFVAERGTRRGVIVRLYQRYNAGNRDKAMLDVIASSEAAYEAVTMSECVNPIRPKDGHPTLKARARHEGGRRRVKAGAAEGRGAKGLSSLPKDRVAPALADPKQPLEKRAQAALEGLMGYTNVGSSDNVSLFRANAVFYYYLSLGTDGACVASPELKNIAGAATK